MSFLSTPHHMGYRDNNDEVVDVDITDDEPVTNMKEFVHAHYSSGGFKRSRRRWWCGGGIVLLILLILFIAAAKSAQKRTSKTMVHWGNLEVQEMKRILQSASPYGGLELDDPTTYQHKAFQWILNNPVHDAFIMSAKERLLQRYALACIYYSTFQASNAWLNQNFGTEALFGWKNSRGWLVFNHECDWFGITCDDEGHVTDIDLGTNDLAGALPSELAYLANSLVSLNVEGNYCFNQGEAEHDFLGKLTNLRFLYMRDGLFQNAGIPAAIGRLTALQEFDCSYNLFHGPIRGEIFSNLRQLRYLEISGNNVDGTIPTTLAALPSLKYFYAANCNLIGSLDFVMQMPVIVETWLDRNPLLSGRIPSEMGTKMSTLESFSATRCALTGKLPTTVGDFARLQQLWLYFNQLTGTVPTEIGRLARLRTLNVEGNRLMGNVPESVCALTRSGFLTSLNSDCDPEQGGMVRCDCCHCCGASCVDLSVTP